MAEEIPVQQDYEFVVGAPLSPAIEIAYALAISSHIILNNPESSTFTVSAESPTIETTDGFVFYASSQNVTVSFYSPSIIHTRDITSVTRTVSSEVSTPTSRLNQELRTEVSKLDQYPELIKQSIKNDFRTQTLSNRAQLEWNEVVTSNISDRLISRQLLTFNSNNYSLFSRGLNAK